MASASTNVSQSVDGSLESKVDYEIEGDMPLVSFFETLRDGTKKSSKLRKTKEKCEKKNEKRRYDRQEAHRRLRRYLMDGISR